MLGGSCTYVALSASFFTQPKIVGVVGDDFAAEDTEFLADARRQKLEIDPVLGEEIEALIGSVYASPPDVIARARAAILDGMGKTVSR